MKTLRCFLLALLALAATATPRAQVINGDLDQSGTLDVNDITTLIDNYVKDQPQYINTAVDHYAVDNSLVAGSWYNKATAKYFVLKADGTADSDMGKTYKFLPSQGRILFFNEDSVPVASVNVAYIGDGYLAVIPAGSDVPQICVEKTPGSTLNNGREYVDMGLSVKWATVDIGAADSGSYDDGNYFAWGETVTKSEFTEENYKWYRFNPDRTILKYNLNDGYGWVDKKDVLVEADDVAHVLWGGTWRMPTLSEFQELVNRCTWTYVERNGTYVYEVKASNGNCIYLRSGDYWSSSLLSSNSVNAWYLRIWGESYKTDWYTRYTGRYVRPVCK